MSDIKIQVAAVTNVGLMRKNNEDNFVVCPDLAKTEWCVPESPESISLGEFGALLVVADGMGGMNAGEVASQIAVETIREEFTNTDLAHIVKNDDEIAKFMTSAVKTADLNILKRSKDDSSTRGMGTTVIMLWVLGEKAHVCWCGDSRCYVFNPASGLNRLSKDHSYVQQLVDAGELEEECAFDHPMSNIITRSLGDEDHRSVPDYRTSYLSSGDIFLLCSDGLCGLCRDEKIMDVMNCHTESLTEMNDELISSALQAGGYDNVTVALCAVELYDANPEKKELNSTLPGKVKGKGNQVLLLLTIVVATMTAVYLLMAQQLKTIGIYLFSLLKQFLSFIR